MHYAYLADIVDSVEKHLPAASCSFPIMNKVQFNSVRPNLILHIVFSSFLYLKNSLRHLFLECYRDACPYLILSL